MLQKLDISFIFEKMNGKFTILTKCPLFIGLADEEITQLLEKSNYQVKHFNKGVNIAQSGEEITAMLVVLSGSVKGEMMDFSGKTIKIEDIGAPRPLAPAFLFGQKNVYPVNISTNEPTDLLFISKQGFVQMMQINERVLSNFLNIISSRAQFLSNKIKFLSFQTIKGKLAHYILQQLKHSTTGKVVLEKSQSQLAELFGVTRPSLGRAIREMDQDNILSVKAKEIVILDKEKLSALLR